MTVTLLDPARVDLSRPGVGGGLRLVDGAPGTLPDEGGERGLPPSVPPLTVVPDRRRRRPRARRTSPEVRRRRTVLAVMGLLLIALALPLSGTGGRSHPAGSALAENRGSIVYTVQPGDSLWSIAERVDPTADPRPLVAKLASQTGSESVTPGERIVLP